MPYWKLYYHFIWGTKKRLPLIDAALEPELYRAIVAKAKEMGGFVHAIGGTEEHVHLAVSVPPKLRQRNSLVMSKGIARITSTTLSNQILNSTGRMNMAFCLLGRRICLRL